MLYGNLSSIVKQDGSTKDVYYKMTMRLMDLETGLITNGLMKKKPQDEVPSLSYM